MDTGQQKGPFFDWGVRAGGIAARAVSCSLCRQNLIEKVRGLRREGKRDEVEAMKPEFDQNRDQWQGILGDARKFHEEFTAKFPDRSEQNKFVAGMRREALANQFVVRHGVDTINVASQIMWVVAPWDKDTQGLLQLRLQTGCNITDTHPQSLRRLLKAGQDELKKLAQELPTLEDMAQGKADFGAQQVSDEMDEITANIGCAQRVLARVAGATTRKKDEQTMQRGAEVTEPGGREVEETDPVKKLEKMIEAKTKAMQAAASRQEYDKAGAFKTEIEGLQSELEDEKRKLRESGATAMAGATPQTNVPVVTLKQVMVVDEETGSEVTIEQLIAKYETQVGELTEAAGQHDTDAGTTEAEGDKIILEGGSKAEAGKKFMSAEIVRNLATKCRTDAEKLTERITELRSKENEEKGQLTDEAKKLVKDAAETAGNLKGGGVTLTEPITAAAVVETHVAVVVEGDDPIAALEAFVEDAEDTAMVEAVAYLLEAAKVARQANKGAKQIIKAVAAAKSGDIEAIRSKTAALVALAR